MPITSTKIQLDSTIATGGGFYDAARAIDDLSTAITGSLEQASIEAVSLNMLATTMETVIIGAPGDDDKACDKP